MRIIKLIFDHDENDFLITKINGTEKEIANYYINNWFNFGVDGDIMKQCTSVIYLGE